MSKPSCIILGGPNGSGKSSAYAKLQLDGVWINADEIAKELTGTGDGRAAAMAAGRAAIRKLADMIATKTSFIYETTLSSQQAVNLMRDAKAAGFSVGLYYVALDSIETNVERVKQRVEAGGHDIPQADIRRRYAGSLDKLAAALTYADEALLMDNSGLEPHEVFRISAGEVVSADFDDRLYLHHRMIESVCIAYGLYRVGNVFRKR
ncbi:Predicted ABC-type ATPase [Agrobacterium fabrum]|uniref:zeta toxin family protein n=1 Tax=Agrobacterium fabrum TaxID=1176649 RepID=UPI00087E879F|nr:zeta toxin family protein [Agrobacterium fabrum]SDB74238.1 Predicted ABC-type ATPase [Agrobacterium fabrum]SES21929.1 Predicted ABC-type ATPase [Agrobacterium fabrum]